MADDYKVPKSLTDKIDDLNNKLDDIYTTTYSSDTSNKIQLDVITDDIYDHINHLLANNNVVQSAPNITQLYTRIQKQNGEYSGQGITNGFMEVFGNQELVNTLIANSDINRYIKTHDLQVDMVLKYNPKLLDALNIKKDNVLCADNFNKDFLNVTLGTTHTDVEDLFSSRVKELKKKYKLVELFEDMYDDSAKYGEAFIYKVPYKTAFERLQAERDGYANNNTFQSIKSAYESATLIENGKLTDREFSLTDDGKAILKELSSKDVPNDFTVNLEMNNSNILSDVISAYHTAEKIIEKNKGKSLYEAFSEQVSKINEADLQDRTIDTKKVKLDNTIPDELEYEKIPMADGLTVKNSTWNNTKIKDIPGVVLRKLQRENVLPIYIENICLGYYYLEFNYDESDELTKSRMLLANTFDAMRQERSRDNQDVVLKFIANKVSQTIDNKFINANQDLAEEIYVMLKYNRQFNMDMTVNNIKITYLPPEDVYHFFFKQDPITHRGIPDMENALIPALFKTLLGISTTLGQLTRSQDHRIFYVKQNVEQNIAKTMLNVVNQLKKGNMGIRQMESMNTMLNIIGKYNDFVIPKNSQGEAPVEFEVMQGQEIQTPTDLMNKFEEDSLNALDVPLEWVNSVNQVDYAIRFTMSNVKFMRLVMKRQAIIQPKFTDIFTDIYNFEYGEHEHTIQVVLPPPTFISVTNGMQLIQNARDFATAVAEIEYPQDQNPNPGEKAEFIKVYVRQMLPSYIDTDLIDKIKAQAKLNIATAPKEGEENNE